LDIAQIKNALQKTLFPTGRSQIAVFSFLFAIPSAPASEQAAADRSAFRRFGKVFGGISENKNSEMINHFRAKIHNKNRIAFFFHPDYTVGFGVSPNQPFGSRALPPVGTFTLP